MPAFFKHIESAKPDHLLPCYAILAEQDFERKYLLRFLRPHFPENAVHLTGQPGEGAQLREPSLFGGELFAIVELGDVKKKELDVLASDLANVPFLLTAKTKNLYALKTLIEKKGAFLDLLGEKKWEKEKRFKEMAIARARHEKKVFENAAVDALFLRSDLDLSELLSETEKLACFVGEKKTIEVSDVQKISSTSQKYTVWQIADRFVWKREPSPVDPSLGPLFFSALRSQFQMGYKILTLLEKKEALPPHFPRIWPRMLEQKTEDAKRLGKAYFMRGILSVFDAELQSRTTGHLEPLLLYAKINPCPSS